MPKITFNNKNNPFFTSLKQKVEEYFRRNNIEQTGNKKLYFKTGTLLTIAILLYVILVFFTPHYAVALLLCSLLGLAFAAIGFNVMHDGAHGSYSTKPWVNETMAYSLNLMGGNAYLWKQKHNIAHHSYTNIEGMDDDIDIKPFIRTNANQPRYWFHRFQHYYWVFFYLLTYAVWIFSNDFKKYFTGKIGDTKYRKMNLREHVVFWGSKLAYAFIFLAVPMWVVGVVPTLVGFFVLASVCGLTIGIVFQLAHVVEDTVFPMPDESTNKIEQEWAVHQITTTANFATKSKIISWFTGGLNFQVEHHLFPKISHIHYPAINKLVKETCMQFNINYIEYPTVYSALKSHVGYLKYIGKK
jgi:linoleoyl-CoA desaturase